MTETKALMDILSCLEKELECYQSLHRFALEQKRVLSTGDLQDPAPELEPILKEKDLRIGGIRKIEEKLAPLRAKWSPVCRAGHGTGRENRPYSQGGDLALRIEGLVNKMRALLEELLLIEEETRRLLSEKQIIVKAHLQDLQKARSMLRRYLLKRSYKPRFLDTKG